uniref:Uncharacterized protein n=1 Tax=viral metagenome TaxID=1070528 RepID=A0A6C0EEJ3_9ZZZZ
MSNIFLKSDLNGIFNEYTESNISLPNVINIVDNNSLKQNVRNTQSSKNKESYDVMSATSSINNFENINNLSNTSTQNQNMFQTGGNGNSMSVTSSDLNQDVSKLISMLTSESTSSHENINNTELSTEKLENQLRNILNKNKSLDGNKKIYGGNNINAQKSINHEDVKQFFVNLKNQGVNVNVKLDNKTMSDFFDNAQLTTTDLKSNLSSTSSNVMFGGKNIGNNESESGTSSNVIFGGTNINNKDYDSVTSSNNMFGGADDSAPPLMNSEDMSSTSSMNMTGGAMSEGFQMHLDFKKFIAEKLNIPNGVKPNIIVKAVKNDVKKEYPNLTNNKEILKKAKEMFLSNINNYKKLI